MNDTIIRRTYNRHGDCDYLTRMEDTPDGWCPVWCADKRQAVRVTDSYAADLLHVISLWRDPACPDGISGVEAVTEGERDPVDPDRVTFRDLWRAFNAGYAARCDAEDEGWFEPCSEAFRAFDPGMAARLDEEGSWLAVLGLEDA